MLEGLEFDWQMTSEGFDSLGLERSVVVVDGGSLWVANCQIAVTEAVACIGVRGAECRLHNCDLTAKRGVCPAWLPVGEAQLQSHHCVLGGRIGLTVLPPASASDEATASIRLVHNTITTERAVQFAIGKGPKARADLNVERNVFDVSYACMLKGQRGQGWLQSDMPSEREASSMLRRIVQWREHENVYSASAGFLAFGLVGRSANVKLAGPKNLPDWLAYWEQIDAGSTTTDTPRALPKDVGADARFVGAGMAHQRWKQTDEYPQWLARIEAIRQYGNAE